MGKRKRKHKQAVIAGEKPPFRASPDKPKASSLPELGASDELSEVLKKIQRLKEQRG